MEVIFVDTGKPASPGRCAESRNSNNPETFLLDIETDSDEGTIFIESVYAVCDGRVLGRRCVRIRILVICVFFFFRSMNAADGPIFCSVFGHGCVERGGMLVSLRCAF